MKFICSRSSTLWERPCEEARGEFVTMQDWRSCPNLDDARHRWWFAEWHGAGANHRAENGMVVCERRKKERAWIVELENLEDLVGFQKRNGWFMLVPSYCVEYPFEIVIKDR